MKTNKDEKKITHIDDDQIFGDNDQIARVNIEERNKDIGNEDSSERARSVIRETERMRDKLNEKKNQVRDYGSDAREIPL